MDSPVIFFVATFIFMGALLVLFLVVLNPRLGRIPIERRRPDSKPDQSPLGRVTQTAVSAVDGVIGDSGGPYNRAVLFNAGVKTDPATFTVMVAVASLLGGILGTLLANGAIGVVLALASPFLAKVCLSIMTDKRRGKFEAQLTDTIQMLIGGLRVGHSIMRSIEAAASEADAPTSEELTRIVNETRIGMDVQLALDEASKRMDSEDFRWIGQAIQINREVGGDLAGVLEQVAGTIRERSEIKGQVRALSGEGKMSAYILMAMPVVVGIMISFINPGYTEVFFTEPLGMVMLVASLVMFSVGGFWMSRIIKIKF